MNNYLDHLRNQYDPKTFQRKIDYIRYNFSPYFKGLNKKSSVLELGPGFGEFVKYLNNQKVTNIDILDNSKGVVEYNKAHYKINNTIYTQNIKSVDRKLRKYDIIFLLQILEHVPKKQFKPLIQTLYKHLNPQGYIIITVPNGGSLLCPSERYNDLQHETAFTEISLRELPNYCKLRNYEIEIQGYRIPPYSLINIPRIIAQKTFHIFLSTLYIINGGVLLKIYHPNISLIIRKLKN